MSVSPLPLKPLHEWSEEEMLRWMEYVPLPSEKQKYQADLKLIACSRQLRTPDDWSALFEPEQVLLAVETLRNVDGIKNNPAVLLTAMRSMFRELESFMEDYLFDYSCSHITEAFLNKHGLHAYATVSKNALAASGTILEGLLSLQTVQKTDSLTCNSFACVLLSSGAGKTQLAATAALGSSSLNYHSVYLCLDESPSGTKQSFYKPHENLTRKLKTALTEFLTGYPNDVEASTILNNAESFSHTTPIFRILHLILFGPHMITSTRISLKGIRQRVIECPYRFLVFVDEVPARGTVHQDASFRRAILLRNLLRAIGVSPILMGTHLGAQNAVGNASRTDDPNPNEAWATIITSLPKFVFPPHCTDRPSFLIDTDRPLVLQMALQAIQDIREENVSIDQSAGHGTAPVQPYQASSAVAMDVDRQDSTERHDFGLKELATIIERIRKRLQAVKEQAWNIMNGCQLLQLFRLEEIDEATFDNAHSLIGNHFGSLTMKQFSALSRETAATEMKLAMMTLVSPKKEPLLHLALTAWDMSMLEGSRTNRFPLSLGPRAFSVRKAFNQNSSLFHFAATIDNPPAKKLCGDKLEVITHAALSLASMGSVDSRTSFLSGTPLPQYIAWTAGFMKDQELTKTSLQVNDTFWKELPPELVSMKIPAFGTTDSPLSTELTSIGAYTGLLTRPGDSSNVDGIAYRDQGEKQKLFQVECKNYSDGVGSALLQGVFQRIQGCRVALVFVSSFQGNIFAQTSWGSVRTNEKMQHPAFGKDQVSIAVLSANEEGESIEYKWMKIKDTVMNRKAETDLLIIVFIVGKQA